MKNPPKPGEQRQYVVQVQPSDTATFASGQVHPVYATFAVARDAEWVCRLFVLEMKEADEEGIGTFVTVNHHSPALVGSQVQFTSTVESLQGNELICQWEAKVGERLLASGRQGQKILKKTKLDELFAALAAAES
jgi:fluoroacetyl-CoA thioesterase